ncbi:RIC1-domain-containing protein [Polychaeton citri CBS 116435]|uniref:RIC1-domain-containing protein n=1 Tax=Polychaeton citri CBS 116435 TaxID=1314669 RepID=A0A9P4UKK8_9PEZI|nr:RIC1-domain-containing protein [Polychaeton citri CBS 116435]
MYWPAPNVSPSIFALSKQTRPITTTDSNDGLDSNDTQLRGQGTLAGHVQAGGPSRLPLSRNVSGELDGDDDDTIIAAKLSRGGGIFATITRSSLTVWQTKPTVALTSIIRSPQSLKLYGPNTALLLRPDSLIIVLQTSQSYLITYTLATDPQALVYQTQLLDTTRHRRRESEDGYNALKRGTRPGFEPGPGEGHGISEANLRFRMVIRIDAGISNALALDNELIVATQKPAALQTIRWVADNSGNQWETDLVSKMPWLVGSGAGVVEMVHDRPMNLTCWITNDGCTYAVQRRRGHGPSANQDTNGLQFQGYCFRRPETDDHFAVKAAINARFSLIAVGCANGQIDIYTVKDYMGNIPFSHGLAMPASVSTTGKLNNIAYSPDGCCLFGGFENGWAMWSVYGKLGANSFHIDQGLSRKAGDAWLHSGVKDAFWAGGGCELGILLNNTDSVCFLDIAKSAATGCLNSCNIARGLLQSTASVLIYKGHEVPDLTSLTNDVSLWQMVKVPHAYLANHWPIRTSVISPDGRFVAVAGRRGLAHYSSSSGRWKTFENAAAENEFTVRGGMCWWQHVLIAGIEVEGARRWQVRLYSREKALEYSNVQHVEELAAPVILASTAGTDSLLVYTHENVLLHYIIVAGGNSVKLVQVGQIGFHGIIRAPTRVRSISWILPDDQLEHGDPSQDVATAVVLFLVDAKLVLLQPSVNSDGGLKYDMRVIANNVEYHMLLRDQPLAQAALGLTGKLEDPVNGASNSSLQLADHPGHSLRDSLWYFDGRDVQLWSDIHDVLSHAPMELGRDLPNTITIPLDFYPLGLMVSKGVMYGLEAEAMQRRDVDFSVFRHNSRTSLFLPQILQYHLTEFNQPAALYISHSYESLPYFAHALEILLHNVLDAEVDHPPSPPETALLPTVVHFLSSFPQYLDVVVNCTRKTELRSWRTLFKYLPPVRELFEESLSQGKLKTAAGYLLVLHTFAQEALELAEFSRLLRAAATNGDWDLCKELARFLVGIDGSGELLKTTLVQSELSGNAAARDSRRQSIAAMVHSDEARQYPHPNGTVSDDQPPVTDYFSVTRQNGHLSRRE